MPRPAIRRQRGASIIELMFCVLIGMIVIAVVYNVLILSEGYKRSSIGQADAQVTGQLTQFILSREIANGGAAMMMGVEDLAACSDWRMRALPVAITAGATAADSDQFTVYYSSSPRVVHPVRFSGTVAPSDPFWVDSPNGFKTGDWVIATNRSTNCSLARVTAITQPNLSPYPPAGVGGQVKLAYTPASAFAFDTGARLINMGPAMTRIRYTVDAAKIQLNSQSVNWLDPGFPLPVVPLAQNIVLMKAQYGVDTDGDNLLDCWTDAEASSPCGGIDYSGPTDAAASGGGGVFANAATAVQLRAIKAVRIAIVVRSEHEERANIVSASLVNQGLWLFNCAADDASCLRRIRVDTVLQDYVRYRVYETVIPLRNSLYNQ